MIKKFDEFVTERLFNSNLKRELSGDKRTEDISPIDTYLKNVNWIDMGHPTLLFSEFDFPDDLYETDMHLLSVRDVFGIAEQFEKRKDGIEMLDVEGYKWLNENTSKGSIQWKLVQNPNFKSHIECVKGGERVFFNLAPWMGGDARTMYVLGKPHVNQNSDARLDIGYVKRYGIPVSDKQVMLVRESEWDRKSFCVKFTKRK